MHAYWVGGAEWVCLAVEGALVQHYWTDSETRMGLEI